MVPSEEVEPGYVVIDTVQEGTVIYSEEDAIDLRIPYDNVSLFFKVGNQEDVKKNAIVLKNIQRIKGKIFQEVVLVFNIRVATWRTNYEKILDILREDVVSVNWINTTSVIGDNAESIYWSRKEYSKVLLEFEVNI